MNDEEVELEELYKWLDSIKLSRPKRNVARDFSDGVLVAELLKTFYPRLVEMHNYSPANSSIAKLNNWITLNKKVLKKLDLSLSHEKLTAISSSEPGAIEHFLKTIKKTVENRGERKISGSNEHFSFFIDSNEMTEMIDKENCNWELWQKQAKQFTDDLAKLKNQLGEKDEVIDVLQQKVTHLEAMLELKDQRIVDLTKQLARYREQSITSNNSLLISSSS